MSTRNLPERASLEYLRKLAKERLAGLRKDDPAAKLADAQFAIAREHGFTSWRALKTEIDRRRAPAMAAFFHACASGDTDALRDALARDDSLVRERNEAGGTGLHVAVAHPNAVRLLIEHGADPNARDAADNASALHLAAAGGHLDSVRILLDASADVHGAGDARKSEVIGWAARKGNEAIVDLLLERGARHHIFSAIAMDDPALVEQVVDENPVSLTRRRSRFESAQTPLHAAIAPPDGRAGNAPNHAILERLIDLGANVEATDDKGRTPLALAMLRGDREAMRLLKAAGASESRVAKEHEISCGTAARSVTKSVPMFLVADMRATVDWYEAIGFTVEDRYEDGGELVFARLLLGAGELALSPGGNPGPRNVRLWFHIDRIDALYEALRRRQLRSIQDGDGPELKFEEDLYEPFYGGRQFSIRDLNGLILIFHQPQ